MMAAQGFATDHPGLDQKVFSEIWRICKEGQVEQLRDIFSYEKDVLKYFMTRNARGYTPLHEAVDSDHPDIVQLVILYGISPNQRARGGLTALHIAASKSSEGCVRALVDNGADITLKDDLGHDAMFKAEQRSTRRREQVVKILKSKEIILYASCGDTRNLERKLSAQPKPDIRDIDHALLESVKNGYNACIPILVVAGARGLDCALYLAIQLEQIESIAILLLCKSTIVGDYMAIRSLLSEPPESDNVPWYMPKVHEVLANGAVKMSYPIAVSIMEKNYESTKELLLKTDLDMGQKRVDWSKLKLTILHSSWVYSIAPWVVSLKLVNNHLRKLPKEIFQAMQLRRLDLSQNLLDTVPGEIFGLPNLEYLCLAHNQLLDLPETNNWSMSLLTLDLADNRLTTLPNGIQNSAIEILNLSKNHFTNVPKCCCRIRTLTSLDLSHMPVSSWPREMEQLERLVNLNIASTNIPDLVGKNGILRGGLKGIFKAKARSSKPSNYLKLILLCHTNKVKKAMLSRLKPNCVLQEEAPDIDVFQWCYKPLFSFRSPKFYFNTWMVGCCAAAPSLLPCLLTPSALNVIVWDLSKPADIREQMRCYVDQIVRHTHTANVYVIAVLSYEQAENWSEANTEMYSKRLKQFFSSLQYKSLRYRGMVVLPVGVNAKDGLSDLKQCLYEEAITMTANNQHLIPEHYFSLIPVLEKEQKSFSARSQPGILEETTLWTMFQHALAADPPDFMELPVIVDFLKEAGFLLHYEDPNDHLDQYYFLRPLWLYQALLKILQHSFESPLRLLVNTGELVSLTNVNWNLSATAPLIRLMIRYAIIIPTKPNQFLITSLLPHCSPNASDINCGHLRRQFAPKNKPLPTDLWSRLIGRVLSDLPRVVNMGDFKAEKNDLEDENILSPDSPQASGLRMGSSQMEDGEPASFTRLNIASHSHIEESDDELASPVKERHIEFLIEKKRLSNSESKSSSGSLFTESTSEKPQNDEASIESAAHSESGAIDSDLFESQNLPPAEPQGHVSLPEAGTKAENPQISPERSSWPRKQITVGSPYRMKPTQDSLSRHSTLPETAGRPRIHRNPSQPIKRPSHKSNSRTSIQMAKIGDFISVWDNGIVYKNEDIQFSVYSSQCEVSSVAEKGIEVSSTKNDTGRVLLARLCRLIQKLLEEWFPELYSVVLNLQKHELTQLALCTLCLERTERSPSTFLVEACVHSMGDNLEQNCRNHPETVHIQDMVPDYLMLDLPSSLRLEESMFIIEERLLHRGKSAFLHYGKFGDQRVAVKVYQKADGKSTTLPLAFVRQDMEMLSCIQHPNIVRTFGFSLNPPCVVIEKAPLGNLYEKLMDTDQKISRLIRFHLCCQVASALSYLHSQNIVYRTLKASSILVWSLDYKDEVNIKLANLERASFRSPSGLLGKPSFSSYPAPEMLKYSFREEYSEKVDIYSFGILLYELVTRWQPFTGIYNTDRLPSNQRPKLSSGVTNGYGILVRLMEECWQEDSSLRPSAYSLLRRLCQPSFQCHITSQVLRDCVAVRGCCFVPSVRQIWVYGEYAQTSIDDEALTTEGTQVFILNADSLTVQGSLELKERVSAILGVDNKVWIGMTEACVHAYDTTTFQFTDRLHLDDSVTCIASNDTYVFVAQANGHLKCYRKLMLPRENRALDIVVGTKAIIAMETVGDIVWLSCGNELVIISTEDEVTIEARWDACSSSDQVYALVLSKDATIIWSLVRGDLAIKSWDIHTGKLLHRVDLTEELNWICCEINYDPTYLRLVSMECVRDTLWLGLTCGVIVILSAEEDTKIITHFRAHRSSPKCLLDIPQQEGSNETHVVLSGGFGEILHSSNLNSEQNGVIVLWQALCKEQFKFVAKRHKDIQKLD